MPIRLPIIPFILALFATAVLPASANVGADTLMLNGRCGVADTVGGRILVAVADGQEAAAMPESIVRDGVRWAVETTTMPIVALAHGDLCPEEFRPGEMTLVEHDGTARHYGVELRHRGKSSLQYTKKNYALKLTDADGAGMDARLLGMRSDNSWILDAMASDMARMRNRVSMDLWLALSARPYYAAAEPAMVNGTRGEFVEVFVNNRYWGLYCLTEKVDRKQLKLKKYAGSTVRGVAYKAIDYDTLREIREVPDDASATWQGWEAEYPDPTKGEATTWEPLYSLARLLAQPEGSEEVEATLATRTDLPLWIDYCVLMDLLHADDNAAKNMFIYFHDITAAGCKACVCPWDMDATWGRGWDRKEVDAGTNCTISIGVNYHLYTTLPDGLEQQRERWRTLRETVMTADGLRAFFQRYFDLFRESGAARRETARWNGTDGVVLDFDTEQQYINEWIARRLDYLDNDYCYTPLSTGQAVHVTAQPYPTYGTDGRRRSGDSRGISIANGMKTIRR